MPLSPARPNGILQPARARPDPAQETLPPVPAQGQPNAEQMQQMLMMLMMLQQMGGGGMMPGMAPGGPAPALPPELAGLM